MKELLLIDCDSKRLDLLLSGRNYFSKKIIALSEYSSGFIISPVDKFKPNLCIKIGSFDYHPSLDAKLKVSGHKLMNCILLIYKSLCILRNNRSIKIIVAKNPIRDGLIAIFLAKITKRKTIIEVNGDYTESFKYKRPSGPKRSELLKQTVILLIIKLVLKRASVVKLLYPKQLHLYKGLNLKACKFRAFHEFVPITDIVKKKSIDTKVILTMGHPWYLKGVDILINAFKKISKNFPEYTLKVYGWCPEERDYFERLIGKSQNIKLCGPVEHKRAIEIISHCSIFVLASRTEGMGRVLLEAMALKKPIVGADVGGIPTIIKDGENGILFQEGNAYDLADKIKNLLSNHVVREDIANKGYQYVCKHLSEKKYALNYKKLIDNALDS